MSLTAQMVVASGSIQHQIARGLGLTNAAGTIYSFWSGFGSDLAEYTVAASLTAGVSHSLRRHNCHRTGCWRIGIHPVIGTPFITCRRHHPLLPDEGPITAEHIDAAHRRHVRHQEALLAQGRLDEAA